MKKKIVLVKDVKYNFTIIYEERDLAFRDEEKFAISEVIEVDFPELDNETVINSEVAVIDKQITKVNADAQAALTALEGRKAELLSITYKPVE